MPGWSREIPTIYQESFSEIPTKRKYGLLILLVDTIQRKTMQYPRKYPYSAKQKMISETGLTQDIPLRFSFSVVRMYYWHRSAVLTSIQLHLSLRYGRKRKCISHLVWTANSVAQNKLHYDIHQEKISTQKKQNGNSWVIPTPYSGCFQWKISRPV